MTFVTGAYPIPSPKMRRLKRTAQEWFRIGGVVAIVFIFLPHAADGLPNPGALPLTVTVFLLFAGAAGLFWRATGPAARNWTPARHDASLAVEALLGLLVASSFVHVLAAQIGFVHTGRRAARSLALLNLVCAAQVIYVFRFGEFDPAEGARSLPPLLALALTVLTLLGWNLFAFLAGLFVAGEQRGHERLARINAELIETRAVLAQASRAGERVRIARDLHDTLGHHLTALTVTLDLAARVPPEASRRHVEQAHLLARLLLSEVRNVVGEMREGPATDLVAALRALSPAEGGPRVDIAPPSGFSVADPELHTALFRCAQEALTNAIRHAGATQVWMRFSRDNGIVRFEIEDDGRGAVLPPASTGNGLRGIHERLEALGGALRVDTGPGFRLTITVPEPKAAP